MWTAPKPFSAAGRPASRQPAGLLRPLCGLSEACSLLSSYGLPKATLGILDRPQTPLGSWQACLFSWPVPGLPLLSYSRPASNANPSRQLAGLPLLLACPRPASSLLMGFDPKATLSIVDRPQTQLAGLPPSSYGFRKQRYHCGPPPNTSRQLAGLPATLGILNPPQTLLGSWQAYLSSSYGLPKATLRILDGPQTLLGSWQACLFSSYGFPKATLEPFWTALKPFSAAGSAVAQAPNPFPGPLAAHSCTAALPAKAGVTVIHGRFLFRRVVLALRN